MQKFQTAITSPTGDVIPNAVITVLTLAGAPAEIYSDNGITQYPTNQVTTDSQGEFSFYAANGRYSYTVAAPAYTTESYTDFLLYDPDDSGVGLSVIGFGAVGDGVTDDTAAFQAAVAYASAQKGGLIFVPSGTYLISSTITINTANVGFQGEGSAWNHLNDPQIAEAATVLRWTGASGGTMLHFISDGGISGQKQSGGGVEEICFDSGVTTLGTGASYAIRISSWNEGFFTGLYFYEFQVAAMLFDCVPYLNDARSPQMNRTVDCASRNSINGNGGLLRLYGDRTANATWSPSVAYLTEDLVSYSGNSFKALQNNTNQQPDINPTYWLQVTGQSAVGSNVSLNHFEQLAGYFTNGNWLDIYNTDHNFFFNTRVQRTPSGTGYAVAFHGSDFTTNTSAPFLGKCARYNIFFGFSGGYAARAYGSPTYLYPSFANNILVGDSGNNFPSPLKSPPSAVMTVDKGASVYVTDDQSQNYRSLNVQGFFYPYSSQAAFDAVNGVQTNYPYGDSTTAGAYFFGNGTLDNAVFGKYTVSNGVYYPQYQYGLQATSGGRFALTQGFLASGAATTQWNSGTAYVTNDLVLYGGLSYVAIANTTGNIPSSSPASWSTVTTWSSATSYLIGALVVYQGITYQAIPTPSGTSPSSYTNLNNIPSSSPTYWRAVTSYTTRMRLDEDGNFNQISPQLIGYGVGAGSAVTQGTSRTTPVTINNPAGSITLFTAAGATAATTFTVNNSLVSSTDTIILSVRSSDAANKYVAFVTAVATGSFDITFYTTGGTTSDAPVINFSVIRSVST